MGDYEEQLCAHCVDITFHGLTLLTGRYSTTTATLLVTTSAGVCKVNQVLFRLSYLLISACSAERAWLT